MSASPLASSLDELLSNGDIECADGLLEPYLNDLFNLPTKNIKSAFGLILGLIKAQSAEISGLKTAQLDHIHRENEVRIRLESGHRTAVSKWESGCNEITEKLRLLKKDQNDAFKTQEKADALVIELKDELKTLASNFQGLLDHQQKKRDDGHANGDKHHQISTHGTTPVVEVTFDELKALDVRMKQLEHNQQKMLESVSVIHELKKNINDISLGENALEEMKSRLTYVESLLSGFDEVDCSSNKTIKDILDSEKADSIISSRSLVFDVKYPRSPTVASVASAKESFNMQSMHEPEYEEGNDNNASGDFCNDSGKQTPIAHSTFVAENDQNSNINYDTIKHTVCDSDGDNGNNSRSMDSNPTSISGEKVQTPRTDAIDNEINAPTTIIENIPDFTVQGDQAYDVAQLSDSNDLPKQDSGEPMVDSNDLGGLSSVSRSSHFTRSSTRPPDGHDETDIVQHNVVQRPSLLPNSSRPRSRTGTVMLRLEERESQMELSIRELSLQILEIQAKLSEQECSNKSPKPSTDTSDWAKTAANLLDQIGEIETLMHEKVSKKQFDDEIEALREIVDDCVNRPIHTISTEGDNVSSNIIHEEVLHIKRRLEEQISQLKTNKLDRDELQVKLCRLEESMKRSLDDALAKQQMSISNYEENTTGQLDELRSIVDSRYNDENLLHETAVAPPTESIEMSAVDARIQKATAAVRISLEEELTARLEELKCIEKEMDALASKLDEKPSQDQIDLMMKKIEHSMAERLGADNTLQLIMENLRLEMKQKMTKKEVLALVKYAFSEAKVGIQNTKSTLMIGRTSYKCLGCNQSFPGVNGSRAPKVNHDALPPAVPLTPNISSYHRGTCGVRRSLRPPVQSLRSVYRPKSAITTGRFAPNSITRFNARKYSR
mmetsp:Transcript_12736/g.27104  ORF Transcript_12736/g.27104 Transcript_12736/m.27104 type:complete len:894 (-) Transcript_12736:2226-4907(-)